MSAIISRLETPSYVLGRDQEFLVLGAFPLGMASQRHA